MHLNPLWWKNTEIVKGTYFFCTFFSVLNTLLEKTTIINWNHLFFVLSQVFSSSVAFDANFLRSFLFIPSKILRKLWLHVFGGIIIMWVNTVLATSNLAFGVYIYIYISGYQGIIPLLDGHKSKEPKYAFNIFNSIMTRCISHSRFKKCTNNFLQEQVRLLWSYSSVSTESQKPHHTQFVE